jgi:glycosyltransferase involved in cell wall biosynthesis
MIIFAHLLNDRSGSPRVLWLTISALLPARGSARLFIGSDGSGILDDLDIKTTHYWYRRTPYRLLTLCTYMASQISLVWHLFRTREIDRNALIYVNTLLPFGAALYGWLTGRRVIYHIHEVSISPSPLRWLLVSVARLTSSLNIYVSDAHMNALPIKGVRQIRLYNALDDVFTAKAFASTYNHRYNGVFRVLMVASMRDYKGVPEFLKLAASFSDRSDVHFDLVVNDDQTAISRYLIGKCVNKNFTVHARVSDTSGFYANASLVLNLSRVDEWVETFGLTILEAMAYGVPVIVPPTGGPIELVTNGLQGYLIDSQDHVKLFSTVQALYADPVICKQFSTACRVRAADFSQERFRAELITQLNYFGLNADV